MNIKERLKSIPVVGFLLRWSYTLLRLNNLKHRVLQNNFSLKSIEERVQKNQNSFIDFKNKLNPKLENYDKNILFIEEKLDYLKNELKIVKEQYFQIEDKYDLLEQELERKSDIEDTIKLYEKLLSDKEHLLINQNKLEKIISKVEEKLKTENLKDIVDIKDSRFSLLYKEFEDKYRGSIEDVKESLEIYLPFISNISDKKDMQILDLGCGRGEWLELLVQKGYSPKGIDINSDMIKYCKERFLDVEQADILKYLKNLPENSLSLITGFHIIEHLDTFDDVLELLQESYRVLQKGGFIIFETPNPRNILVSSSDFYLDPSHNKPLHPLTMKFFTKQIGYHDVKSLIINENKFKDIEEIDFTDINDYIYIGRNYAVVGRKP